MLLSIYDDPIGVPWQIWSRTQKKEYL